MRGAIDFGMMAILFDEKGIYIRKWIKEFDLGYGKPMVEHAMARDRAIATYKAGILK